MENKIQVSICFRSLGGLTSVFAFIENLVWGDARAVHPYACLKISENSYRAYELSPDAKKNGVVSHKNITAMEKAQHSEIVIGFTTTSLGTSELVFLS
jgi:hypothetical protein